MGAIVYQYHSVLRFPTFFSFSKQPKLGKPIFSLKEIADVSSPFERKGLHLTVSCIGSEGNRRDQPRRRTTKKDVTKKRGSVGKQSNSSNQEQIIALFRRIQSSISKEESVNAKKINSNVSEDQPSSESILNVLSGSGKQKGKATNKEGEGGEKVLTNTKEQKIQEDNPPVRDFKLTRPPSKFVKRSPIPSPSTILRGKFFELNNGASPATARTKELDLVRVEEMKLPQLKELAKSRGIKGYSKLKKSELVKLLKS